MYTLLVISFPNFSSLGWFLFSSAFDSCHQLLTAVDSWWQLICKKLTRIFMYTLLVISLPNFSSLGWFLFSSSFNSCNQLLTADDSCHEKKIRLKFSSLPKCDIHATFELCRLLGSRARDCDAAAGRQVKLGLTQALLGLCQGLSWAIHQINLFSTPISSKMSNLFPLQLSTFINQL